MTGTPPKTREEVLKELDLVLEAKKNINSILTTMYSVFYSVAAFMVYAFYSLTSVAGRLTISVYGIALMAGLMVITIRARGTNSRCDSSARKLEEHYDLNVVSTYDNTCDRGPLGKLTMHGTLIWVDGFFTLLWAALAVLEMTRVL